VYVELHAHSAFSFLDGASLPDELAARAAELGYEAVGLTDHNGVSGSMEFAMTAKVLKLKAIHGAEIDLDDGRHLTLLVKDNEGWANLCRLLTRAHAHTRAWAAEAAEDKPPDEEPHVPLRAVLEHANGLICLSGCASHGVHDRQTLEQLKEAFDKDNLRIELQRPYLEGDMARNRSLKNLAQRLGLRTVATGNVHAHARQRAPLQDALVALRNHTTLDASEPLRRGNWSHVLATPQAMAQRFAEFPEAVAETQSIAQRIVFDLGSDLGYRYPGAEDQKSMQNLTELCTKRLHERYEDQPQQLKGQAQARLTQELNIIGKLDLPGFFLLHSEMLELAREVAVEVRGPDSARAVLPPGRGRGSSVSSIVCYLTGLSHVDPILNELMIGRFLSEDLNSLPDIDLDFPRDIRHVLIPRVHSRFGRERTALVAAFPTFRARGAIRELGKVLGLPPSEIERVARGSEGWDARSVGTDVGAAFPDARRDNKTKGRWAWLARLAAEAHGLPRHLSQHSGGMIVATQPLTHCCPIVPAAMEDRQIAQWDKDSCADAGFLKIDLLGLGMLSAVERCVEMIDRTRGERIDLSRIPPDDPETYATIQKAETTGVFQIESRAQMQSLLRTRPASLKEIAIQVAIVRPGPIQGGAVNPYIERLQRLRKDPDYRIPYEHPALERALKETLGAIIFQDQVLEVAQDFAGFSMGRAESLRRAMSRKRSEAAIEAHHQEFVEGAMRLHGASQELAEQVFTKVKGFAGFGFPKAHAAAFGLLAYQSTYLRVHYGPEFLCALLNEQPMGFYPPDALVHEAQRRGMEIMPPDVNASGVECEVAPGGVRIGLAYVRGVRTEDVEALVAEREQGGPFKSLADLAARAGAGRAALTLLAWAGTCDRLAAGISAGSGPLATAGVGGPGLSPRRLVLWQLGVAAPGRGVPGGTQLSLPLELPAPPELRTLNGWERMLADYGATGLTAAAHPLALLRTRVPADAVDSRALDALAHGTRVRVPGLVVARQRPGTAGGVVFVLLEDEHGVINLVVPPGVYEQHRLIVRTEPLLLVTGKLEKLQAAGGAINVLVDRVSVIDAPGHLKASVTDFSMLDERVHAEREREAPGAEGVVDDFRAVAPPVMSFASGRRR
jgi:error-prone DNA polymerase